MKYKKALIVKFHDAVSIANGKMSVCGTDSMDNTDRLKLKSDIEVYPTHVEFIWEQSPKDIRHMMVYNSNISFIQLAVTPKE